ncbi:Gfo/Idh/MocA family protein [Roseomonas sp. CCTCC AB2023176]|uniref:Gfo/Idh/MocA family protein n=1 Tax=Roseomonas sp. CCTCC AB2023176 TaxID=3342640 RepID=UPI0035D82CCC
MAMDRGASRRGLLRATGWTAAGVALGAAGAPGYPPPVERDVGRVEGGRVTFPEWRGEAEPPSQPPPQPRPPGERVGYAIIGLGRISLEEMLPAFGECRESRPVALVTGSPEKGKAVARQHGIPEDAVLPYEQLERLRDRPDVQAAYVALPNAMHREYTERLAAIGKHVLCEKPMATRVADAEAMVAACAGANVRLMIAYRCQYEPYNRAAIEMVRNGELGRLRFIEATNVQVNGPAPQWRYSKALAGGGAMPDVGIYCLNAARYLTGEEPEWIFASLRRGDTRDPRFAEVEEGVAFGVRFPSGVIANCVTSYDAFNDKTLRLIFERGIVEMPDAFSYEGQRMQVSRREGQVAARTERNIRHRNQFALEVDHFSQCVRENRQPHTPGEEGVQDQRLMEAIYRSAEENQPVRTPRPQQATRGPTPGAA